MLGKTAGGLFWMFRFLERSENTARLIEAGFRIALTRSSSAESEWKSVLTTAGARAGYEAKYDSYNAQHVVDFLLRDPDNPSSIISSFENARTNARLVRTAITTEVWEAVNDVWMNQRDALKNPIRETDLPAILAAIRQQSALVRGAMHGTMLRNDIFYFSRIGTYLERADNTARIIDVKYYTLLPSASFVGSSLDTVQWELLLRSVSAHRAFRWLQEREMTPGSIAEFLMLDERLPRSLVFSTKQITHNLDYLSKDYGGIRHASHDMAESLHARLSNRDIGAIFEEGLHSFIGEFLRDNHALGAQIQTDFRFNG